MNNIIWNSKVENPPKPGFDGGGIEVEDMKTTVEELKSKGAKITRGPMPIAVGYLPSWKIQMESG